MPLRGAVGTAGDSAWRLDISSEVDTTRAAAQRAESVHFWDLDLLIGSAGAPAPSAASAPRPSVTVCLTGLWSSVRNLCWISEGLAGAGSAARSSENLEALRFCCGASVCNVLRRAGLFAGPPDHTDFKVGWELLANWLGGKTRPVTH